MKLWGGRFSKETAGTVDQFIESIEVDEKMISEDIWGSEAHVLMLGTQGILTDEDVRNILIWLEKAKTDYSEGKLQLKREFEDVHMNIESYVINGAGPEFGGKLHTARSRNDQVLVDSRMYVRKKILEIQRFIFALQNSFLELAKIHKETVMPGYTHTQHAQPITVGYWATAYASMLSRDVRRLSHAYEIVNLNPLGSCALAGTSFPTDRELTTKLLGFDGVHIHSLDVISSRDFVIETLSALAIMMSNLSKLAEEMVLWSTFEFRMIELDDAYTAGSSIMPQKKNPCVAELTRARSGRVYGSLMQLLTIMKGLPMGYNRDLQEDKTLLWDALEVSRQTLIVLNEMLNTMKINSGRMLELVNSNFSTATELANYLVREKNIPFRRCHEIVGNTVAKLISLGKNLSDYEEVSKVLKESDLNISAKELESFLDPVKVVQSNKSLGSTSPAEIEKLIAGLEADMQEKMGELDARESKIEDAKKTTSEIVSEVLSGKEVAETVRSNL